MGEKTIPILPCRTIHPVLDFYTVLGFEVTYQQKSPNPYAVVERGGIQLHFFGMKSYEPAESYSTCCIQTDDVDGLHGVFRTRLKAAYGRIPTRGLPRIGPLPGLRCAGCCWCRAAGRRRCGPDRVYGPVAVGRRGPPLSVQPHRLRHDGPGEVRRSRDLLLRRPRLRPRRPDRRSDSPDSRIVGKRVGFTVYDNGKHDRVGYSWAVETIPEMDVPKCLSAAPYETVASGDFRVKHVLPPSPGREGE
jgi:hypothetical protein